MAYDANKDDNDQSQQSRSGASNPYADLAGGQMGVSSFTGGLQPTSMTSPGYTSMPGSSGPNVTGHVNFDQLYNANAGTSEREAGKLQTSARQKAQGAQQGLTGLEGQFASQARTGTVQGPTAQQQEWARSGSTGVTQPKKVVGAQVANARTGQVGATTEEQEGLVSTRPGEGDAGVNTSEQLLDPAQAAAMRGDVERGAQSKYSGPNALSDLDQYAQLAKDTAAAQDEATTLASGNDGIQGVGGMSQLDASLLGAAGRPGFEQLGHDYGNMNSTLDAFNTDSQGFANAARQQSDANANAYQQLLGEYDGRVGADQASADAANKHSDDLLAGAQTKHDNQEAFNDYLHGGSGLDQFRNTLHGVARATDLTDNTGVASGGGIVTAATDALSPQSSTNKGNESGVWASDEAQGKDDSGVWASMTDSDWAEFASLTDQEKHAWIERRRAQLKGGG